MYTSTLYRKRAIALHLYGLSLAVDMPAPVLAATNAPTQENADQAFKTLLRNVS
ncbi:MAG: hypothetical protein V4484_17800 [Pseudomonadota bacterium]